jgi:FtsH-binding integral membrane protein
MNASFVLGAALGQAFAATLITFALSALAIQNQRKAKLGWQKTVTLFVIAVAIMTVINVVLFFSAPSLLTSKEESTLSIVQSLILPLTVSVGTLLLLWKPKVS